MNVIDNSMGKRDIRKYIEDNIITKDGSLNKNMNRTNKHETVLCYIRELYNLPIKESLYLYYYNIRPMICECGKQTNFISFTKGYREYCSAKCRANSNKFKNSIKEANIKNYGVENPMQSKEIQDKVKQTNIERYGVNHNFKRADIINKRKQTFINKYGVENPMQSKEIQDKVKQTNIERYGVSHQSQIKEVKERITLKNKFNFYNKLLDTNRLGELTPLFNLNEFTNVSKKYKFKCNICDNEFESNLDNGKIPRCFICNPRINRTSNVEKELADWIKSLNIDIIENDKSILNPYELDVYIPSHSLAIEFNGLYWHSELNGKDKNYHLNKTIGCEEKGIQLIHIFEDEWLDKKDIIKNIIKIKLGMIDKKIYGRKCVIKELKSKDVSLFYDLNHIQGFINSSINIGLLYEDELVSCLSFSKSRYDKKYDWEITRYANKLNTSVIGGFNKLLKFFKKNYEGSIITYSDRRLFNGSIYRNNGFTELDTTKPNYFYIDHQYRYDRQGFMKHKLKEKLDVFDPSLTEWQNMQLNKYDRIWDVGNYKFELSNIKS